MDHPIPARMLDLVLIIKIERPCHLEDFTIPADHREKKNEKIEKYLYLARELRKLWKMKVTVIIVIGTFGMVPKCLVRRLEESRSYRP